jgi:hypothetical protein
MDGPMNVKSPNNTSKWQMGFNSAFKGLLRKREGRDGLGDPEGNGNIDPEGRV